MSMAVIEPRIRGFIATNAHPLGCRANVRQQIAAVRQRRRAGERMNVLVVGASTGYGLAARIVAAFGYSAGTLGVFYERPPSADQTASAGYYNTVAFHEAAREAGLKARSLNGDAFSDQMKAQAIEILLREFGKVDLVIYSLASPRRTHPKTGIVHKSALKPIGRPFTSKTIDLNTGEIAQVTIEPATEDDIVGTIDVMGGEDLSLWTDALVRANALADNAQIVPFSYIGPPLTHAIYRNGTIGKAKEHLEATTRAIDQRLEDEVGGRAYVAVNKAVVTNASAAIPVVPLYLSMLYPIMQAVGTHEAPIDQMNRLFTEHLESNTDPAVDDFGRIRLDDLEMHADIQAEVLRRWIDVNSDNVGQFADVNGFQVEFRRLFGFGVDGIDYAAPTEMDLLIE